MKQSGFSSVLSDSSLTLMEQCFHVEVQEESFVYAVLCQHFSAPYEKREGKRFLCISSGFHLFLGGHFAHFNTIFKVGMTDTVHSIDYYVPLIARPF